MWTTLSVRIALLSLAVVMLFSASEAMLQIPLHCCNKVQRLRHIEKIKQCFEQKERHGCKYHAFMITNDSGKTFCVEPTVPWLKNLLEEEKLKCPPDISKLLRTRFEVLDEDDLE
ncbi:hypothetical protein PFLUV_G00258610 [Perca fluviatilis]|uniref:Chemokine interleukin-8-like domain-containing protein n=2 Tax=Perca fluviatilis TaxID=8168 RepID=A0A6A5EB83_PERFL|nr:hypothetical protein PFLUV_G00258610 [Perca fluviatilis]